MMFEIVENLKVSCYSDSMFSIEIISSVDKILRKRKTKKKNLYEDNCMIKQFDT